METNRIQDSKKEQQVHKILENSFYKTTMDYQSISDKDNQIKGIDSIFTLTNPDNNKPFTYVCDEKAATDYIGKKLSTFILELSFINKNNSLQDGWFLDDSKQNNSFLFVWLESDHMDYALVRKDKLQYYLNTLGWTTTNLKRKAQLLRTVGGYKGNINEDKCKFTYSTLKPEKPVCIMLEKSTYMSLSDYKGSINETLHTENP